MSEVVVDKEMEKYAAEIKLLNRIAEHFDLPDVEVKASAEWKPGFGFAHYLTGVLTFENSEGANLEDNAYRSPQEAHAVAFSRTFNDKVFALRGEEAASQAVARMAGAVRPPARDVIAKPEGNSVEIPLTDLRKALKRGTFANVLAEKVVEEYSDAYKRNGGPSVTPSSSDAVTQGAKAMIDGDNAALQQITTGNPQILQQIQERVRDLAQKAGVVAKSPELLEQIKEKEGELAASIITTMLEEKKEFDAKLNGELGDEIVEAIKEDRAQEFVTQLEQSDKETAVKVAELLNMAYSIANGVAQGNP
ncbi:MAG: hypothetical protein ACPG80_04690, partial [Rickettsiales bacterium]